MGASSPCWIVDANREIWRQRTPQPAQEWRIRSRHSCYLSALSVEMAVFPSLNIWGTHLRNPHEEFLMEGFDHPDICWRSNIARHKPPMRFLENIDDNFLTQLMEEPIKKGVLLGPCTSKQGRTGWRCVGFGQPWLRWPEIMMLGIHGGGWCYFPISVKCIWHLSESRSNYKSELSCRERGWSLGLHHTNNI